MEKGRGGSNVGERHGGERGTEAAAQRAREGAVPTAPAEKLYVLPAFASRSSFSRLRNASDSQQSAEYYLAEDVENGTSHLHRGDTGIFLLLRHRKGSSHRNMLG